MDLGDFETTVKVIVVGNGGVGKSSMTARYCRGVFTSAYKKTIGVDFLEKTIEVDGGSGEAVKLMIWDTAGQEEFDALTSSYYRGAGAVAIVFSTVDRASFEAAAKWKAKVEAECGPIACALVQNKVDLLDEAVVTPQEVEALARRLGVRLYRTCVKENLNVSDVFEYLAAQYILRGGDAAPGAAPAVASIGEHGLLASGNTLAAPIPAGATSPRGEGGAVQGAAAPAMPAPALAPAAASNRAASRSSSSPMPATAAASPPREAVYDPEAQPHHIAAAAAAAAAEAAAAAAVARRAAPQGAGADAAGGSGRIKLTAEGGGSSRKKKKGFFSAC